VRRGEIWWADFEKPVGRRPIVLLSRNEAYFIRGMVTVAPLTTRIRGIPVEVLLDESDGVPKKCVANLDMITTVEKSLLTERICALTEKKIQEINDAIRYALGLID
jgi:mRNA interferase MazF